MWLCQHVCSQRSVLAPWGEMACPFFRVNTGQFAAAAILDSVWRGQQWHGAQVMQKNRFPGGAELLAVSADCACHVLAAVLELPVQVHLQGLVLNSRSPHALRKTAQQQACQ